MQGSAAPDSMPEFLILPGLDGTGARLTPFLREMEGGVPTRIIDYPRDQPLGYAELELLVRRSLPQGGRYGRTSSLAAVAARRERGRRLAVFEALELNNQMLPMSEACERNKEPILAVLRICFAECLHVLEIGSGTGQHAVYFARHLTHLTWHPTEQLSFLPDLTARAQLEGSPNLRVPTVLDVRQSVWPVQSVDAVFTANTLHIMSWPEVGATFRGIGGVLAPGGVLGVYGPFRYAGEYTSDSNRAFDRMLQERDPRSGLRDVDALKELAASYGLELVADHDLPAFNRLLIFAKEPL